MELIDDPRDFPQHVTIDDDVVTVHVSLPSRVERAESIIHGMEGTLRNIRSRAQAGIVATSPVFMAHLLEEIDAMAALALMGDLDNGADDEPERRLYDEP